jgi:hypothetical protein
MGWRSGHVYEAIMVPAWWDERAASWLGPMVVARQRENER